MPATAPSASGLRSARSRMPRSNTIVRSGETRQERLVPAFSVRAAESDIRAQFLNGMSRAAFCVSVVTTDGPAGCSGVTISAMSSVSADGNSPTILVCIHHQSRTAAAILENGTFCVNVLREDQSHIADRFGGRVQLEDGDKFAGARWVEGNSRAASGRCGSSIRLLRGVGGTR